MKLGTLLFVGLSLFSGASFADGYPEKGRPIKIVVPFGAASSTDLLARSIAQGITEVSGQPVFVENRAGAEGVIGMVSAKGAAPDGYTLVMTTSSTQVLNPYLLQQIAYDPVADFAPVTGIAKFSLVMNAGPSVQQKTAEAFIQAARSQPGKFSFGSGTTTTRLAGELLQYAAGVQMLSVPYKSMAEAMTGLAAGQVDLVITDLPSSSAHYKSGRVRPLAVTGVSRMKARPDLPTLQEAGVSGYEMTGWWAAYFPGKTPAPIVKAMRDLIHKASETSVVKQAFATFSLEPLFGTEEELATLQRNDLERWGKLVREAKLGPPSTTKE